MSKAFVKESDDDPEDEVEEDVAPAVPKGTRNYITMGGAAKLKAELKDLLYKKRPELTQVINWAASNGDRSENADYIYGKRRLREIDRRIRFLTKRIESFDIVDPASIQADEVRFGATVTVVAENGDQKMYSIVGIDETNVSAGHISWISPLGAALLKKKEGDLVVFKTPKGERELEVQSIRYVALTT